MVEFEARVRINMCANRPDLKSEARLRIMGWGDKVTVFKGKNIFPKVGLLICCSQDSELHFGTSFVPIGQLVQEIPPVDQKCRQTGPT